MMKKKRNLGTIMFTKKKIGGGALPDAICLMVKSNFGKKSRGTKPPNPQPPLRFRRLWYTGI